MIDSTASPPHPDRVATTLAVRARLLADHDPDLTFAAPGLGSADARVDLKLLAHRARVALETRGTDAAREHLRGLDTPDLWAGTVRDGTARGFMARLEEAISLCEPEPPEPSYDAADAAVFGHKELRRKRDILVASKGARIRFSRKGGVLFVDRKRDVHRGNCIWFEDRRDTGDLDGFAPAPGERARLFNPGFLKPTYLEQGIRRDLLTIVGRLGRRPCGYPCEIRFEGRKDEPFIRMTVRVRNDHTDHRLRIRFLDVSNPEEIGHDGTPGFELVHHQGKTFVAATLVRACGRLRVGDGDVPTPMAQCGGWIEHEFFLSQT